jgi:periplasmic copper chaperone A
MRRHSYLSVAIVLLGVVVALGGCGAKTAPQASNAFSYACAAGGDCGAFMTITSAGAQADKLVAATTPVTPRAELHTMVKDAAGKMAMQKVDNVDVPASGSVELKPGSFHIMMFGLTKALNVGDTFPVTLKFEQGGETTVQVKVQAKN